MSIEIITVNSSKLKNEFINLPWKIYNKKDYPQWVAPLKISVKELLDTKKNPFYKRADIELFLAKKDNVFVGRIAAIKNNAHNEFWKDQVGFYGFFECINDQDVATQLFNTAESWLKEKGFTSMRGPMNPSTNHEAGLLVNGQDQHPTIMTTWNPSYYINLHTDAMFTGVKDLVAYYIPNDLAQNLPAHVTKYANHMKKNSNITFRNFDMKNFNHELEICYDIYNCAWEENWGFFPMTKEEFMHTAKDMKAIMDPRWAFIAEHEGKPAGFMLALPDINQILKNNRSGRLFPTGLIKLLLGKKFIKTVRIITLGVKKEFRNTGIFSLFTFESFERSKKFNISAGEASWILEDNRPMNRMWQKIGCPLYRKWRIYERPIL